MKGRKESYLGCLRQTHARILGLMSFAARGVRCFFGVLVPRRMSSFMRFRPAYFIGVCLALLVPRFAFHKLNTPVMVEWSQRDWAWSAVAIVIAIAYFSGLTPARLAVLIVR